MKFKFQNQPNSKQQIMNQQQAKQTARSDARKSEHFKFNDFPPQNGHAIANNKKHSKKRRDGLATWSDYVTYDSGSIEIPISDDDSITISVDQEDSSSLTERSNSKSPPRLSSAKKYSKVEEAPVTKIKELPEEKEQNLQKSVGSLPSQFNPRRDMPTPNLSPFAIPNLSQIKPKESNYLTRNSEKFLLDLLNKDYDKVDEQLSQAKKEAQQNEIDPLPNKEVNNPRKSTTYKNLERKQQLIPKQSNSDPLDRQSKGQSQVVLRQKRVTINDRGRIKFPTDSISGEYQYLLPSQLRETESPRDHKKKLVIEEEQDEEQIIVPKAQEPMDIVNHQEQKKMKEMYRAKERKIEIKNVEEKLIEIAKNAPKRKPFEPKKSIIVRVCGKQSPVDRENSKKSRSSHKNFSKDAKQPRKKPVEIKANKNEKKSSVQVQQKRVNKYKKQQKSEVEHITEKDQRSNQSNSRSSQNNSRPKRTRTNKLQFWKCQKPIYSKGLLLGVSNLSNQRFLEIIGFHSVENIKTNKIYFSVSMIQIKILLKPNDRYYSSGIDESAMKQQNLSSERFNELEFSINWGRFQKEQHMKVVVDGSIQVSMKNGVKIRKGQTISLENISISHSVKIDISFYNGNEATNSSE